jgi:hypothetical protein
MKYALASWDRPVLFHKHLESPVPSALSNCLRKRVFVTGDEIPRTVAHRCVIEDLEGRGLLEGGTGGRSPPEW